MRILAENLTVEQVALLQAERRGAFVPTLHAAERQVNAGISGKRVRRAIEKGELIEFHDDEGTRRILVRRNNDCVVLDLDTRTRITTYPCADGHATLEQERYVTQIPNVRLLP